MTVAVRVIPCLDVDGGRVVKGVNFASLRDAGDPVELAAIYDRAGADELTFLDITASSDDRETMYDVVRRTADQVFIPLTVGGGVRSTSDVDRLLRAGADKVALNTAAVARPDLLREAAHRFGAQCVVLSVDARRSPGTASGFEVTTHGGRRGTGIDAVDWARQAAESGAGEILLNSVDADGTKSGFDLELIQGSPASGARSRHCQWRCGGGEPFRASDRRGGRRRARREPVPFRRAEYRRGQGCAGSGGAPGPASASEGGFECRVRPRGPGSTPRSPPG